MAKPKVHGAGGFTLAEVVVAVAIAGIVAAMAAPALVQWQADQRLKEAARVVAGAFTQARGEAVRRGNNFLVFFVTDVYPRWLEKAGKMLL